MAISMDGMTLFQSGSAQAFTGTNSDFAMASGANSVATAYGSGSYATVFGTGSTATAGGATEEIAGSSSANVASVSGDGSHAYAVGTAEYAATSNYSVIFGNGDSVFTGSDAFSAGNYDAAYAEGNNLAPAYAQGGDYLFALAKFYGDGGMAPSAAATDLLGSDVSGLMSAGSAFWTDLFSGDLSGAVAEGNTFWADLAALY